LLRWEHQVLFFATIVGRKMKLRIRNWSAAKNLQLWSLVAELAQGCPKGSARNFNQSAVRRVQLHH
jgi:hypothetical protein